MDDNTEISSSAETLSLFESEDTLQITVEPISKSEASDNFDFSKLPQKRTRKATQKKLEYLQNFSPLYQCLECSKIFSRLNQLKNHSKSHSTQKVEVYKCVDCGEEVGSFKSLVVHRRQYHEVGVQCPHCQLDCDTKTILKLHLKSHKGERPYVCKECGTSFSQSGHLSIHTRTHTGEKPYTCDICHSNFKQISHLKTHVRTHTHDKPYRCTQCASAFTQNSSLKRHKRSHTGEKPYKCLYCDMTFVVKSNMQRHLNTHTGERPFHCDLCTASFGQAIDLKRHTISHTGIKPFRCDYCQAAFSRKNNLKWHKLTHSSSAGYECSVCSAGFSTTGDLKAHMRNHAPPKPFTCHVCPSSFRLLDSLNRHKMIHSGGQPLRIKSTKGVITKTSKAKPYHCELCDASFCEKRNLKRHTLSIHNGLQNHVETLLDEKFNGNNVRNEQSLLETFGKEIVLQDTKHVMSIDGQTCFQPDLVAAPTCSQQLVMQAVSTQDGFTQIPQFLLTSPGQAPKPARPAGQCQNHTMHILTYIEGSMNHWQSWCFCDPPNIPESSPVVLSTNIGNEIVNEGITQILVTTPVHPSSSDNPTQIIVNANPPGLPNQQVILSSTVNPEQVQAVSTNATIIIPSQTIPSTLIPGNDGQFYKEVKIEREECLSESLV